MGSAIHERDTRGRMRLVGEVLDKVANISTWRS